MHKNCSNIDTVSDFTHTNHNPNDTTWCDWKPFGELLCCVCLPVFVFVCLLLYPAVCLPDFVSACVFVCLLLYLSVCLSLCPAVVSICLFVCLLLFFICLFACCCILSVCLSACYILSVCLPAVVFYLSACLLLYFICLPAAVFCLSVSCCILSVCLPAAVFCLFVCPAHCHSNGLDLSLNVCWEIQTHKRFKRAFIYYDVDNRMHIFRKIPIFRPQIHI